jgi:tRNA A22 N-methylase
VSVLDIGADHAFLCCYIAEKGDNSRVIAVDAKPEPLKHGQYAAKGLPIEFYLSDGFTGLPTEVVSDIAANAYDIVVAGLGGETIIDILRHAPVNTDTRFILQPMSKTDKLRDGLAELGYNITEECTIQDGKRAFAVFVAEPPR